MSTQLEMLETQKIESNLLPDFEQFYTLEDFLSLDFPEDDETEYELMEGTIVPRPNASPSAEHGEVIFKLARAIGVYLETNPIGRGYAEAACTLGQDKEQAIWVRPDFSFILKGRTAEKFLGPIPVAPDIIAEINSPSDTIEGIQRKIELYQKYGVKLLWEIYLLHNYVIVYVLSENRRFLLDLEDELDGGGVLPRFKMPVKKLFD